MDYRTPHPSYRIFRAAWVSARAVTPSTVRAVLAVPWTLLSIIPGTLRGGLYMDQAGTGMVLLYRSRMLLDVHILLSIMLLAGAGIGAGLTALIVRSPSTLRGILAACLLLIPFLQATRHLAPVQGGSLLPSHHLIPRTRNVMTRHT